MPGFLFSDHGQEKLYRGKIERQRDVPGPVSPLVLAAGVCEMPAQFS